MAMEASEANLQGVAALIRATLSGDNAALKKATAELQTLEERPGYSLCLLQLLTLPALANDLQLKQGVSIAFKNCVLRNWNYEQTERAENGLPDPLPVSDRDTIKQHLLALMVSQPKQVQAQLGQALAIISRLDFPAKWPTLLPELVRRFSDASADSRPEELIGVLEVMHSIFYRYRIEMRSDKLWGEIKEVVTVVCEPLNEFFYKWCNRLGDPSITSNKDALPTVVHIVSLVSDLYLSLCSQELVDEFGEKHVLQQWMGRFIELLQFQSPLLDAASKAKGAEEEPTHLDQLKATICDVVNVFTWKYEDEFAPFVPRFVDTIWNVLSALPTARRYDLLVGSAVRFLTAVVKKAQFKQLFANEAALATLCEKVIVPQLRLRDSDIELFDMNPQDYIRVDVENDADTRRRNTVDLIHGLCVHFEAQISTLLKNYVGLLIAEYDKNKKSDAGMIAKDLAMCIVLALSAKSMTAREGVVQLNPHVDVQAFFTQHVLTELSGPISEHPVLKADCLKFLTAFRQHLPASSYPQLFPLICRYLASEHVVLHTYASHAIERMLNVKETNGQARVDKEMLRPHLQSMLEGLFGALQHEESKENEYLMRAIMRVCSVGQDAMVPFASVVIERATAILRYISANPKNPKFNHSLFETLAALVKYLCKGANPAAMVDNFEAALFPPFQTVLSTETAADFGPYVFQILAQLLELRADLSGPYIAIFPALLVPSMWANQGNIPAITRLLCAYLQKPSVFPGLLQGNTRLDGVLGIFSVLLKKRTTEEYALQLLTSLFCGAVGLENLGQEKTKVLLMGEGMLFPRLQPTHKPPPSPRLFRSTAVFFLTFLARHGLDSVQSVLNAVQPGILAPLLTGIVLPNAHLITAEAEKRTAVVGLTTLLTRTPSLLADQALVSIWPRMLLSVVQLLTEKTSKEMSKTVSLIGTVPGITTSSAEGAEDPDDLLAQAEKESSTAYARLVFAGAAETNYTPTVTQSEKEYFASSLNAFTQQFPGKLAPMLASLTPEQQAIVAACFKENNIAVR